MFGRSATFLDSEDECWHLESWLWMLRNIGGLRRLRASPHVLATREFFPPTDASGHARAEHIFACMKKHCGLTEWPCTLAPQPQRPQDKLADLAFLKPLEGHLPAGTFSATAGEVVITYDPDNMEHPAKFVATLAHELAHYLLATKTIDFPGGEEMHEYLTDLATVFLGFGLFNANCAFNFSQFQGAMSQGWQTSRLGYLPERDWAFALAVFAALRDENPDVYKKELKPHLYSDVCAAARYLSRHADLLARHRQMIPGESVS